MLVILTHGKQAHDPENYSSPNSSKETFRLNRLNSYKWSRKNHPIVRYKFNVTYYIALRYWSLNIILKVIICFDIFKIRSR